MSIAEIGAGVSGIGSGSQGLVGAIGSLFGSSTGTSGSMTGTANSTTKATAKGVQTEELQIEDAAVQKIIRDVLSGPDGLAAIFAGEQSSGLYNSSSANQAAGDLAARLVGEIAKLKAKKVATNNQEEEQITDQTTTQTSKTKAEDGGVLKGIGDFFGF